MEILIIQHAVTCVSITCRTTKQLMVEPRVLSANTSVHCFEKYSLRRIGI